MAGRAKVIANRTAQVITWCAFCRFLLLDQVPPGRPVCLPELHEGGLCVRRGGMRSVVRVHLRKREAVIRWPLTVVIYCTAAEI